jgi:hypothetical protein
VEWASTEWSVHAENKQRRKREREELIEVHVVEKLWEEDKRSDGYINSH